MTKWLLLSAAIAAEVAGTLTLRATVDNPGWLPVVIISYVAAFTLIGLTLRAGMPVGAVYGIWGASGVALVAALGVLLFQETLSLGGAAGIAVIIAGVILIETGSRPHPEASAPPTAPTPEAIA